VRPSGLKLLLIGGPRFLGRALIESALARGHAPATFNRGQTNPEAFPEIEKLHGDRTEDVSAITGRHWDAVIDTSGYVPADVRRSAEAVDADRYCFISSVSYYADYRKPRDEYDPPEQLAEGAPVDRLADDYSNYGALKALCETAVNDAFGHRALNVRPGLIVGPNDPTDRFTYWPRRVERGGPILAPPDQPIQLVDVRDLADFTIRLLEDERSGPFNVTSPPRAHTFSSMFADLGAEDVVWVTEEFMAEHEVQAWSDLPCATPGGDAEWAAFQLVPVERAVKAGLAFRPLAETARDVPEWTGKAGLTPEREAELLREWTAR